MNIIGSVPRIEAPSLATFRNEFALPNKPVIICGATDGWKALFKWTREYLESAIGSTTVQVLDSSNHIHPELMSDNPMQIRYQSLEFTDYTSLIWSDDPARKTKYLVGNEGGRILGRHAKKVPASPFASLAEDFELPGCVDSENLNGCGFSLSSDGILTRLHYDYSHNLNVQVVGRKRFLLFSDRQYIHPFLGTRLGDGPPSFSQIDIENPDLDRFPEFRGVECQEAVLEEGEMLFIPGFWPHAVYHLGRININIHFFWQPDEHALSKMSFHLWFLRLFVRTATNGKTPLQESDVAAAMQGLNPETLAFLQNMERGICELRGI